MGIGATSLFQPNHIVGLNGLAPRTREVGEAFAIGHFLAGEKEGFAEGILRGKVYASGLEVAVNFFDCLCPWVELVQSRSRSTQRALLLSLSEDALLAFFHGNIQQTVAHQVDQAVG